MNHHNTNFSIIWVILLLILLFSPVLKVAFNILIGLLIGLVIFGLFTYFSTKKKLDASTKKAKEEDVYEHFYDNKTIGEHGFDKAEFMSDDQYHDGDIIDAKVVEPLKKRGDES